MGFKDVHQLGGLSNKPLGSQDMSPAGSWAEPDEYDKLDATDLFEQLNEARMNYEEDAFYDWLNKHRD